MKKRRVLIFASYFAPNSFSEALVNNKFALALQKAGLEITVITTSDYVGEKYESQWSALWKPLKDVTHNIPSYIPEEKHRYLNKIKSIILMKHPVNGVSWAYKAYKLAMKLHQQEPFDLLCSRSISDHGHLPALKFRKETGVKWIANWNDPPYFIFPPPYHVESKAITKFFYAKYLKSVAKSADINTFPSQRLYEYIQKKLDIFMDGKVKIVPHLNTDLDVNRPDKNSTIFRICHAGNLSKERSPELFLTALKKLVEKYSQIECHIIGKENVDLTSKIKNLGLSGNVSFTGPMSYKKTLEFLSECTVGLLIEAQCKEGIFLPSKVADYVYASIPILAVSPPNGTLNDLIHEFGGGIRVDNSHSESILHGLEKLYLDWRNKSLDRYISPKLLHYFSDKEILHSVIESV